MSARDPLQEIEEALSFEVSSDFCARVRQQVATEPVRPKAMPARWWAMAAAALAAIGIGVVGSNRAPRVDVVQVSGRPAVDVGKIPGPSVHEPVAVVESARIAEPSVRASAAAPAKRFDTVVPDDQLRALDRLLASLRQGRADVPAEVPLDEVNERGERVLKALVIAPVTIEPLAGMPAEPNRAPGRAPNK